MNEASQLQYSSTRANILKMLAALENHVEDAINPEDATYGDLAELSRIENQLNDLYNQVTKQGEYS